MARAGFSLVEVLVALFLFSLIAAGASGMVVSSLASQSRLENAAERAAGLGVTLIPEGRQLFPEMTVRENLQVGGTALSGRRPTYGLSDIHDIFPILKERSAQRAGS